MDSDTGGTPARIDVTLESGGRTPLYQQIVDRIWLDVIEGVLESGQRLPTVRQFAVDLGVHLDTVSRAYQKLEQLGVVHNRRGAGTFIGLKASRQAELERQRRLQEICETAAEDVGQIGGSIDDVISMLSELRRGTNREKSP